MLSPGLAALAAPLVNAVASVSAGALRGVDAAFDQVFRAEDGASTPDANESPPAVLNKSDALQSKFDDLQARFQVEATARLAEAGITLSAPLTLESDPLGGVRVAGLHPQARAIEQTLNEEPRLGAMFEELARIDRDLSRQRHSGEVERLYSLDPHAARQLDAASIFDDEFRITLSPKMSEAPDGIRSVQT